MELVRQYVTKNIYRYKFRPLPFYLEMNLTKEEIIENRVNRILSIPEDKNMKLDNKVERHAKHFLKFLTWNSLKDTEN